MNTAKDNIDIKAGAYIPSLYFAEGLPYVIINVVSAVIYTKMGIPKDVMAFWTGFLYLPWVLKMFWSPLLENCGTKKHWIIMTQLALAAVFAFTGLSLQLNNFFVFSMLGFFAGAFISATYDIATDGYYMLALNKRSQSFYVGIRTLFYRLALMFGGGVLVMLAGKVEGLSQGNIPVSWLAVMLVLAVLFAVLALYHALVLPQDKEKKKDKEIFVKRFKEVFSSYLKQKHIVSVLLIILLYRLGEASLEKMVPPFMLDPVSEGGLGISTQAFGFVKGVLAVLSLITGNILGGVALARYGFRKCLLPFVLLLNVPNLFYVIMAVYRPSLAVVTGLVAFEQFGYGLGFMAFTVFVLMISRSGKYPASHYAISTGLMALGMMVPNMLSGKLAELLGYRYFFTLACVLSVPSLFLIPLILKITKEKSS